METPASRATSRIVATGRDANRQGLGARVPGLGKSVDCHAVTSAARRRQALLARPGTRAPIPDRAATQLVTWQLQAADPHDIRSRCKRLQHWLVPITSVLGRGAT